MGGSGSAKHLLGQRPWGGQPRGQRGVEPDWRGVVERPAALLVGRGGGCVWSENGKWATAKIMKIKKKIKKRKK